MNDAPAQFPGPSRPSGMVLVTAITLLAANRSTLPSRRAHRSLRTRHWTSPGLPLSLTVLPGPRFPEDPPGSHRVAANEQPWQPVAHEQHLVSTLRSSYSTSSHLVLRELENQRFSAPPAFPITLTFTVSLTLGILPRKNLFLLLQRPGGTSKLENSLDRLGGI